MKMNSQGCDNSLSRIKASSLCLLTRLRSLVHSLANFVIYHKCDVRIVSVEIESRDFAWNVTT